jgi:hypothetical protein
MLTSLFMFAAIVGHPAPERSGFSSSAEYRPRVEIWTNRGDDPYHTGQRANVFLRADRDGFVTLFRIDTDGRVRVLYPRMPWEDNFVRGGREFEIDGGSDGFDIDDSPGVGYVFAVIAADPFEYDPITTGDHWDYRMIADGRVRGDPYVALTDLAQRIVPDGYAEWDYDIVPYYVERRYDYPRFLCYDCHSYASYRYWDPYAYSCVRFRIVVFDDPYYYPYRYYGGRRVVFTRPFRPEPRFIFKDRGGVGDDRFVTRERQRPMNDNGRRGIRGADLGRRGTVPAPDVRQRGRDPRPDVTPRRPERPQPHQRPDRPQPRPEERGRPGDSGRSWERRRPDQQLPGRRPDRPVQPGDERQRSTERPSPDVRPKVDGRRDPRRDVPRPETRREPRQAEPRVQPRAEPQRDRPRAEPQRDRPRAEPQRDRPRAEPRRGREAAPSKGRSSGQPELRRRRP